MFIHYGRYRIRRQKIACKKVFCSECKREAVAELWWSFDLLHLFWIPVFPLGIRKIWICTLCKKPQNSGTQNKIILLAFLGVLLAGMAANSPKTEERVTYWVIFALLCGSFLWVVHLLTDHKRKIRFEYLNRNVSPLSPTECIYCQSPLISEPYLQCSACKIRVYTEQPEDRQRIAQGQDRPRNMI